MKRVVVDTDVVSFLFKRDTRASLYLPHLENCEWFISFMTQAELEQWVLVANWSSKRVEWLRLFLGRFAVVPSSHALALTWAEVMAADEEVGGGLKLPMHGSQPLPYCMIRLY